MQRYRDEGFIVSDDLEFRDIGGGVIELQGRITCARSLYIDVRKALQIVDGDGHNATVQTFAYTYCAVLAGVGNVFRYCSPHEDHNQDHHVHEFDVLAGDRAGNVRPVGEDGWPLLGEAIGRLQQWACDHSLELEKLGL